MTLLSLPDMERQASERGLILRIQVRRPFNLWLFRLVVAEPKGPSKIQIWGEMKGWAYQNKKGLQLDIMKVSKKAHSEVGHLIWASTMAWALDETPCESARLLAIYDEQSQHLALQRYFSRRGFRMIREVGSSPIDLPLRTVWGGAGAFMVGDCKDVFHRSYNLWLRSDRSL